MPSTNWRALGTGSVLGYLRGDLKKAKKEVFIIGPWIDEFFADQLVLACPKKLNLKILTRPLEMMSQDFLNHARAAREIFKAYGSAEVRNSPVIHAKTIVIDESIFYCGSANWYRYSLEEGQELVLRGSIDNVPALLDEIRSIWDQGKSESLEKITNKGVSVTSQKNGYQEELLDPIAAKKLKTVPGSFVLGKKRP